MAIILLGILLLLFAINIPISISIGLSAAIITFFSPTVDLIRLPQALLAGLNTFPLLAIPFFIFAGKLMEHGGISKKLVDFASACIGHYRSGLAFVSVLACMFFAAISGSAIATTVAVGSIMIPAMINKGYERNFSSVLQGASGTIGALIPPSVPMVIYGVAAGVSIGKLFMAGILPGILVGLSFMLLSYLINLSNKNIVVERKRSIKERLIALKEAVWALMMPVIILGGIYGGFFTPTEAAAVAVVYGFIVGIFVYHLISFATFKKILFTTMITSSVLLYIIATATFFGIWLTLENIPQSIADFFIQLGLPLVGTIIVVNILLLILGTFMDASAAIIICTPILYPVMASMGMDLVHFGIMMIINLGVGTLTPPLGVNLFVAAKVGNTTFEGIVKPMLPFILVMIIDVFIVAFFPQISAGFAEFLMD